MNEIVINSNVSYLGSDIRKWCKANKEKDKHAANIYETYYEKAEYPPSDKVYYYIDCISYADAYKEYGNTEYGNTEILYRDLEKSPRFNAFGDSNGNY